MLIPGGGKQKGKIVKKRGVEDTTVGAGRTVSES